MNEERATTAGVFLGGKLRLLDDRLRDVVPRALASTPDDEAVHDLRVALRRTRTVLEVGRRVLGRFQCDEVRRSLRDVQRATGALRDEEVLLAVVDSMGPATASVQAWVDVRSRRERQLRRELIRLIEAGEVDRGRRLLGALLAFRVDPSRDKRLAKFARRSVTQASTQVERARASPQSDPTALHELRIGYKRLRYVVETFAEVLPNEIVALGQRAARFQSRLGGIHDIDIVIGCVRRARSLSLEGRRPLLESLAYARAERMVAYEKEAGLIVGTDDLLTQASGTVALRKTSTR